MSYFSTILSVRLENSTEQKGGYSNVSIHECNAIVPQNLTRIIKERGLKQSAVAQWAGYTNQQLTDMLNGRKIIKPCDVMAIATALNVNIGDLFEDTGQNTA